MTVPPGKELTAESWLLNAPVDTGTETRLHWMPSQCSTTGDPVNVPPTAQASLLESAVTPLRKAAKVPVAGLGTILQVLPFQCSISGSVGVLLPKALLVPTAQTS